MKWIKASERLPDKRHNYHVKVDYEIDSLSGTWNTASLWNGEFWEHPTKYDSWTGKPSKLNVAQWLDESQSLSTETGQHKTGRRKCAKCKKIVERHDKWYFRGDGRIEHRHCNRPTEYK